MLPMPFDPRCERYPIDIPEIVGEIKYEWDFSLRDGDPLAIPWQKLTEEQRRLACDTYARADGTFNSANGHFLCNECYIAVGMPSRPEGWVCP